MGPWNLDPADTLHIVLAIGVGEGLDGLRANLQTAYDLYWNDFEGPAAWSIEKRTPDADTVFVHTGETVNFEVEIGNADDYDMQYLWRIDGLVVQNHIGPSLYFDPRGLTPGDHYVCVQATGGEHSSTRGWVVFFKPVVFFNLFPSFPNPFNSEATITFDMTGVWPVTLTIYDVKGRRVRKLTDRVYPAGRHIKTWNGTDDAGLPVPTGCYLCHIQAGNYQSVRKMVYIK
jgi:hypothetical protein